ncbi:MAG: hypothetical protein NT029_14500 [Armatimonadetes bacterium]|nr:hypothetical protein [Armatimonadota bacterium]
MATTMTLSTDVPPSRELRIRVPLEVPVGPAEMVVVFLPVGPAKRRTLAELAASEYAGIWADRDDIGDSAEFARALRRSAWTRTT